MFSEHVKYLSSASIIEGDDICQQKPVVRPKEETDQVYTYSHIITRIRCSYQTGKEREKIKHEERENFRGVLFIFTF